MRNGWKTNPQYILNLTKSLIGERSLATILSEVTTPANPAVVRSYVAAAIKPKLEEMSAESLGTICSYATGFGFHHGKMKSGMPKPEFINSTGLADVLTVKNWYDANFLIANLGDGEFIVEIALTVIVCVVCDMVDQEEYQAVWH